jgi:1-acylglycerone phosphate reductase
MKTGIVKSHLIDNNGGPSLPQGSIYEPAREVLDKALAGDNFKGQGTDAAIWAKQVVGDIIKDRPAKVVWRGDMAGTMRIASCLPSSLFEGTVKKATKFPEIEKAMSR